MSQSPTIGELERRLDDVEVRLDTAESTLHDHVGESRDGDESDTDEFYRDPDVDTTVADFADAVRYTESIFGSDAVDAEFDGTFGNRIIIKYDEIHTDEEPLGELFG